MKIAQNRLKGDPSKYGIRKRNKSRIQTNKTEQKEKLETKYENWYLPTKPH